MRRPQRREPQRRELQLPVQQRREPHRHGFRRRGPRTAAAVGVLAAILPLAAPLSPRRAEGAEHFIEMYAGAFLPQNLQILAGDSVTWVWVAGTHVVTSGVPGGLPGTIDEPGALFSAPVDALHPSYSRVFPGPAGTVSFHDSLSPAQIGFIQVLGDELTFDVSVLDNVFEPELLEIFAGDSVAWVHEPMEMQHTVTSGLSSDPGDDPGALFDEVSSDSQPIFVFTFAAAGDVPYFCIPHELLGMTGLIRVQERFIRGDANRDGAVEIADPITTLGVLFQGVVADPCPDAADANDDGVTDIADVIWTLAYLFSGGPAPAAPFPAEGPDRTADGLLCSP